MKIIEISSKEISSVMKFIKKNIKGLLAYPAISDISYDTPFKIINEGEIEWEIILVRVAYEPPEPYLLLSIIRHPSLRNIRMNIDITDSEKDVLNAFDKLLNTFITKPKEEKNYEI